MNQNQHYSLAHRMENMEKMLQNLIIQQSTKAISYLMKKKEKNW
jgi:hypothetical protein